MTTNGFYFDTADIKVLKNIWKEIENYVQPEQVLGITTSPNALAKVNKTSALDVLYDLCEWLTSITDKPNATVWVQLPYPDMREGEILDFVRLLLKFSPRCKVGLKIPPFGTVWNIMDSVWKRIDLNVTGVTDSTTALRCLSYPYVKYVSILTGRMEEAGIDAQAHMRAIQQRYDPRKDIISGSMRTLSQLEWAVLYNTVPTIGERVWDLILENKESREWFRFLMQRVPPLRFEAPSEVSVPTCSEAEKKLSEDFFKQMVEKSKEVSFT